MAVLFEVEQNFDQYQTFVYDDDDAGSDLMMEFGYGERFADRWVAPKPIIEKRDRRLPRGDFVNFSPPLILSERARTALEELLDPIAELLPLPFEGETYYALNVLTQVNAVRNVKTRPVDDPLAFFNSRIATAPPLFNVPFAHGLYARESFKTAVEGANLEGLKFKQVWGDPVPITAQLPRKKTNRRKQKPPTTKRDKVLDELWQSNINAGTTGEWIDNVIREAERDPGGSFADAGEALGRILEAGADRDDLCRLLRWNSYEAVFATLTTLEEHSGFKDKKFDGLHEDLLGADPTGNEGRLSST